MKYLWRCHLYGTSELHLVYCFLGGEENCNGCICSKCTPVRVIVMSVAGDKLDHLRRMLCVPSKYVGDMCAPFILNWLH